MRTINVLILLCGVVRIQRHCLICVLCDHLVLGSRAQIRDLNLGFSLPSLPDMPMSIWLGSHFLTPPLSHSCAIKDVKEVDEVFKWNYFLAHFDYRKHWK